MIAHLKFLKWIVIAGVLLAAFVGFPYYYQQNELNKQRTSQAITFFMVARDSAILYQNKYKETVTQVEAARVDAATLSKLREDLKDITSRFDNLNKKLNNVEQLSKTTVAAVAEFSGGLVDTVVVRDSAQVAAFKFEVGDQHFQVEGLAIPSLKQVQLKPSFSAEIYAVTYWQRKRKFLGIRFGKKEYKSEITSDNPYLKVSQHRVVIRKD